MCEGTDQQEDKKVESEEGNRETIRVGVWGDVFVNHSIAHKKKSESGIKFLDRENYVQSSVQLGGAPLFAEIIEMISETDKIKKNNRYEIKVISNKHTKPFSDLKCWHSYSIIDKIPEEDEDEKKKSSKNKNAAKKLLDKLQVKGKWRIIEYLGRDDRDDDIDEDYNKIKEKKYKKHERKYEEKLKKDEFIKKIYELDFCEDKSLDILVIIDHNNTPVHSKEEKKSDSSEPKKESKLSKLRINEHSNYLQILNKIKEGGKIIYRISAPINQGDLLKELLAKKYRDNLVLIVTAEAFRESEMYISKDLSWERMAKDAFWSIKQNSTIINDLDNDNPNDYSDISDAGNIIVTFDSAGALHYQCGKTEKDDKCWHYFDPVSLETRWIMKHPGYTLCRGYCVTASIVFQFIEGKKSDDIGDPYGKAILAGLEARRDFHEHGYSSYSQVYNYKREKEFDSINGYNDSNNEGKNSIEEIEKEIDNLEKEQEKTKQANNRFDEGNNDENIEKIKKKPENELANSETKFNQLESLLGEEKKKVDKLKKRKYCFYWDTNLVANSIIENYEKIENKQFKKSNNFSSFEYNHKEEEGKETFIFKKNKVDDLKLAMEIVKDGFDSHLYSRPLGEFGKFLSVDTKEIESFRSIRRLIQEYNKKGDNEHIKPLSIGIFGSPGSGKSYCVKEVVKSVIGKKKVEFITYNLSQMQLGNTKELCEAFHNVRDVMLSGKLPIVFFDEFDCEGLKWLKYFLSPMQDGEFVSDGVTHYIGKSIFVFAGGVFETIKKFSEETVKSERDLKAPDFASRLKGSVDIIGLNPSKDDKEKSEKNILLEKKYLIKRAILLRSVLWNNHKDLIGGKGAKDREEKSNIKTDNFNIEDSLLYAFLVTKKYNHGIRSLESIVYMSLLSGKHCYRRSYLPSREQLEHHVDANDFMRNIICYNFKKKLQSENKEKYSKPEWKRLLNQFRQLFNKNKIDIESDKYLDDSNKKLKKYDGDIEKVCEKIIETYNDIKSSDIKNIFCNLDKYGLFFVKIVDDDDIKLKELLSIKKDIKDLDSKLDDKTKIIFEKMENKLNKVVNDKKDLVALKEQIRKLQNIVQPSGIPKNY